MAIVAAKRKDANFKLENHSYAAAFWREIFSIADKERASDIHVELDEAGLKIRIRKHGFLIPLKKFFTEELDTATQLVITLKDIAGLDTGTRKCRQDASFALNKHSSRYRAALTPLGDGFEDLVLRVIRSDDIPELSSLGLSNQAIEDLNWSMEQRQGLVLVTGTTGSGKSTTMQASLMGVDRQALKVLAIENPVERKLDGVRHVPITKHLGWTDSIKQAMRSDLDIMVVGEIRDPESAKLALEAAQTGHLTLSTLHTNSVFSTLHRLKQMGIEPYEFCENTIYISSQRLIGKLCQKCKIPEARLFARNTSGCEVCTRGISGRALAAEYLVAPDPQVLIRMNKDEIESCLSQSMKNEHRKLVEKGDACVRIYESLLRKEYNG